MLQGECTRLTGQESWKEPGNIPWAACKWQIALMPSRAGDGCVTRKWHWWRKRQTEAYRGLLTRLDIPQASIEHWASFVKHRCLMGETLSTVYVTVE